MRKPLTTLAILVATGLLLGACTKCGWVWDDWRSGPQSCRSDIPKS